MRTLWAGPLLRVTFLLCMSLAPPAQRCASSQTTRLNTVGMMCVWVWTQILTLWVSTWISTIQVLSGLCRKDCEMGEHLLSGYSQLCQAPFFSLEPQPTKESACDICPANANCNGGHSIEPLPGFWHSSEHSDTQIHSCPRGNSCEGNMSCVAVVSLLT